MINHHRDPAKIKSENKIKHLQLNYINITMIQLQLVETVDYVNGVSIVLRIHPSVDCTMSYSYDKNLVRIAKHDFAYTEITRLCQPCYTAKITHLMKLATCLQDQLQVDH